MTIKESVYSNLIAIRWFTAHLIKKILVVLLFIVVVPLVLIVAVLDLFSVIFEVIHNVLDWFLGLSFDFNVPIKTKFFELFGFKAADIYLGDNYQRVNILKLKQVAKENDIRYHIIQETYSRDGGGFFVTVVVSKKSDLNLLKLLFNYDHKKQQF